MHPPSVIHGTVSGDSCSGPSVTVAAGGTATVTVPAKDAVAADGQGKL